MTRKAPRVAPPAYLTAMPPEKSPPPHEIAASTASPALAAPGNAIIPIGYCAGGVEGPPGLAAGTDVRFDGGAIGFAFSEG